VVHRLDAGTSGVLLFSASKETALEVKTLFKKRMVCKEYRALCFCPPAAAARWFGLGGLHHPGELWHDELRWRDRTVQAESELVHGMHCTKTSTALLTLRPTTGFTHQLRVQCARRRLPIVGDSKHGDWTMNRGWKGARRLYLHAENISFSLREGDPYKKSLYKFASTLPEEFTQQYSDFQDKSIQIKNY
jgi:23S rRNA pseudouridine955/2504/2580 synthase